MHNNSQSSYNINQSNNHAFLSNSIIITPYERVLSILNNVKQYINSTSKLQSKLVRNLDWVIKVITSHSLYAYELKEKDLISKLTKENENFKQFVDFVSKYNEQVIEMNKKNIYWGARAVEVANELLQKPSIKLRKQIYNSKKNSSTSKSPKKMKYMRSYHILGNFENNKNLTNGKFKKYASLNNEAILSNKVEQKIQSSNKSGKNLRYMEKLSGPIKQGNVGNVSKKQSDIIREPKIFYVDINKLNTPQKFTKKKFNSSLINKSRNIESNYVTSYTLNNTNSNKNATNVLTHSTT